MLFRSLSSALSWNSANTLTLSAYKDIYINAAITASTGKLGLKYGQGSSDGVISGVASDYYVNAPISLPAGLNFTTQLGSAGTTKNYTVFTALGSANDNTSPSNTSAFTLQALNNTTSGYFALGADIAGSAT